MVDPKLSGPSQMFYGKQDSIVGIVGEHGFFGFCGARSENRCEVAFLPPWFHNQILLMHGCYSQGRVLLQNPLTPFGSRYSFMASMLVGMMKEGAPGFLHWPTPTLIVKAVLVLD